MAHVTTKTLEAASAGEWRRWLAGHHRSESEVWLIFYKAHTGRASISYGDALDEALCVGWIDSLVKRLDDDRYARKFTPRKVDSRWSMVNRKRYEALKAAGRLRPAGVERAPTDRYPVAPPPSVPLEVPRYIRDALSTHPAAQREFEKLPPSHCRHYVGWIDSAKRVETKTRRLTEAIRLLKLGKRLELK